MLGNLGLGEIIIILVLILVVLASLSFRATTLATHACEYYLLEQETVPWNLTRVSQHLLLPP